MVREMADSGLSNIIFSAHQHKVAPGNSLKHGAITQLCMWTSVLQNTFIKYLKYMYKFLLKKSI